MKKRKIHLLLTPDCLPLEVMLDVSIPSTSDSFLSGDSLFFVNKVKDAHVLVYCLLLQCKLPGGPPHHPKHFSLPTFVYKSFPQD